MVRYDKFARREVEVPEIRGKISIRKISKEQRKKYGLKVGMITPFTYKRITR